MQRLYRSKKILTLGVIFTLLAAFSTLATVTAQPTQALIEDWRSADYSFSSRMIVNDLNDNLYVVGDTAVGDYLVIKKFNAGGALLWQTTYDPTERLRGVWIAVDSGNNPVVLASMITGGNASPSGWLTLKYDTNGALLWANSLPGPFSDPRRVAIDANNNIYVAGRQFRTNPTGNTTLDSVLIKYGPGGASLWTAVFDNGSAVDEPFSLAISPDSSRIGVAGISGNLFMALMYDANGSQLWSNTNPNIYAANDLAFGPGNISYFATGTYFPQDPNPYQMAIAKFDAAGTQLSINSYNVGDRTFRVRVDGLGNVVATGMDSAGYMDWMTIKTDANGNLLWSQRYDGGKNNDETPFMLAIDATGAVYVTGRGGPNPGSGNVSNLKGVVVKYNPDGTPQWAVFDDFAGGRAMALGAGNTLASLGYNYLVTTHYTETGLPDLPPGTPTNLSARVDLNLIDVSFTDNASNEFWVDVERCTGAGCTDFAKIGQTLGENAPFYRDRNITFGVSYTYRLRAVGFMGASAYSELLIVPGSTPTPGPSSTPTRTPVPPTPTNTPLPPTPTNTPVPPTPTHTPAPGTSTGFRSPSANAAQTSGAGDNNGYQTRAANAYANDLSVAIDTDSGTNISTSCTDAGKDKHRYYNYNFNIPANALIQGIRVRLDARADGTGGSPKICVQLSWDGGTTWTTTKSTTTLSTSEVTYTLGSTSDRWGRTWTASNFSNANFRLRVIDVSSNTSRDFFLDYVAVNVNYQP